MGKKDFDQEQRRIEKICQYLQTEMESEFPVSPLLCSQGPTGVRCHTLQCALRSHLRIAPPAVSISREPAASPLPFQMDALACRSLHSFPKQFLKIIEFWGPWWKRPEGLSQLWKSQKTNLRIANRVGHLLSSQWVMPWPDVGFWDFPKGRKQSYEQNLYHQNPNSGFPSIMDVVSKIILAGCIWDQVRLHGDEYFHLYLEDPKRVFVFIIIVIIP